MNLPNILTIIRILLIPVMIYFLNDPGRTSSALAGATFFVASVSDFLDGYLARRWNISTTLGKLLDPLADKLIVAAALIMLVAMDRSPGVPAWAAIIIIGREMLVTGLRAVALNNGIVVAAEELGKYKTIFQMFAMVGLLLHYDFFGLAWHAGGMYFLWISLVLAVWSGIDYNVRLLPLLWRGGAASS